MVKRILLRNRSCVFCVASVAISVAILFWTHSTASSSIRPFGQRSTVHRQSGGAQLVSIEPIPEMGGEECVWKPASARMEQSFSQRPSPSSSQPSNRDGGGLLSPEDAAKRAPLRQIHDPFPSFSSVSVDTKHDEIVMTDENLFQILVYDRRTNTPPKASMSEPKRVIAGAQTKIEFQCGIYIDPNNGDIYGVNNDTVDTLVIFGRTAKGNVKPDRELHTPHGTFGIAVDEDRQELFLTIQHSNSLVVYDKMAKGDDAPLRTLQGNSTRLADPHGIALNSKNKILFISNHGSIREFPKGERPNASAPSRQAISGSGHILPSSINVYAIDAKGDEPPLRVISGPNTQLNWPTGLAVDQERGELYVANDMGDSILVFPTDASGDVAPTRVLKGAKTGIKNPTGVYLDKAAQEILVSNFGNHTATAYKLPAGGDTAPLRKIRSGPPDTPALMIGNPGSVAYDSKREQILVPN